MATVNDGGLDITRFLANQNPGIDPVSPDMVGGQLPPESGSPPPPTDPPKPGWQTSEMWITVGFTLLMMLAGFGIISPGDKTKLEGNVANGATSAVALATAGAAIWKYIQGRQAAKSGS